MNSTRPILLVEDDQVDAMTVKRALKEVKVTNRLHVASDGEQALAYLREPEKTQEAFDGEWSSAGDMARRDEDGYYVLVDRKANMIITGGENVYPSEVEDAVVAHEAVKDVAVIGIPDDKWGEAVKGIVTSRKSLENAG